MRGRIVGPRQRQRQRQRRVVVAAALVAAALAALVACAPTAPPGKLDATDDLAAHDPALVVDGDDWYVFATGAARGDGNIQIRRSLDQGLT